MTIRYHIEHCTLDRVSGWAHPGAPVANGGSPNRLSITLMHDGRCIASSSATNFRQDLVDAGYGDGRYGFVLSCVLGEADLLYCSVVADGAPEGAVVLHQGWLMTSARANRIVSLDVIDNCNLRCRTCARGVRFLANRPGEMNPSEFDAIVNKAADEGYGTIYLHNWTEPFLSKNLGQYISRIHQSRLHCGISTNLSLKHFSRLAGVLRRLERDDFLLISISGMTQAVYEINHQGGSIDLVKRNLDLVAAMKRRGQILSRVILRYLLFDYNQLEHDPASDFAAARGLEFQLHRAHGNPTSVPVCTPTEHDVMQRIATVTETIHEAGMVCDLVADGIPVDKDGFAYQCSALPNYKVFRLGRYRDLSAGEIFHKRYFHRYCWACHWPHKPMTLRERTLLQLAKPEEIILAESNITPRAPDSGRGAPGAA